MKKSVFNRNIFRIFVLILSVIFAFTSCAPEVVNLPKNQSVNKKDNSKFKIEYDSESFSIKKFSDYKIKSISSKIIFEQNDFSFNEHFFNRLQVYILSFNMENETGQKLTTNTLNVSYQIGSGPYLAMKDSPPEKYNIKNDPSSGISEQYKQWEYDLESILKPIEATLIQDNDDNCSGSSISYVNFSGRELLFPVQKFNFVHSSYDDIPVEVFKSNNDTRKKDYFYSWSDYVEGRPKSQKQQPYEYFGNFSSFPLPQINGKIRLLINATKRTGPNEIYRGFENDESNFIKSQPFEISQEQNVTFNEQSLKNNFNVYITSSVSETYNATLKSLSDNTFIDWVNHRKEASTRIINPDSFISIDKRYLKSGQYQLNIQFCKSGISKTYNFNVDCSTPAISKEVNNSFSVLAIPIPNGSYESRCGEPVDEENGEDFPLPTPTPGPSNDCIEKLLPNQLTGGSGFSVSSSSGLVGYVQNVADYTSQIKDKAILYNKSVTQVDKLNVKLVELQMKPQTKSVINQIADLKAKRAVVYGEMNSVSIPLNYTLLPNLQSNYDSIKNTADSLTENESDGYVSPNPHDDTSLFSLQKYKDYIEEYDSEFEDYIYSENTYGMVSASRAIFKESRLYRDLVIQFLNQSVSKIVEEPDGDITEQTKLDTLTTGLQVIKYLSNRINSHNTKLNNKISQLQQEVETLKTKVVQDFSEHSVNIQKLDAQAETFSQLLDQLDIDADEPAFTTQSFRIKLALTEEQARKLEEKLGKEKAKWQPKHDQLQKDHPYLTGAGDLVVDQFTNPVNVIPLPGAGPLMGKAISQAGKFIGENALALWMKIAEKKGFAYAMGKMDEFNLSLSQMAKDSLEAAKSFFKSQADVNDLSRICKSAKCSNSFKLGQNIFDAPFDHLQKGLEKPRGWQSHHIVPENSKFADDSRALLEKYGIDYKTDAYNGVNLPKGKLGKNYDADPNFPDVINHSETFKKEYPEKVLKRLEDSIDGKPEGDRKEILQNELKQIGEDILIGNKFW